MIVMHKNECDMSEFGKLGLSWHALILPAAFQTNLIVCEKQNQNSENLYHLNSDLSSGYDIVLHEAFKQQFKVVQVNVTRYSWFC